MTLWILRQLQLLKIFEFGPKIAEVSLKLKGLTNLYYNIYTNFNCIRNSNEKTFF